MTDQPTTLTTRMAAKIREIDDAHEKTRYCREDACAVCDIIDAITLAIVEEMPAAIAAVRALHKPVPADERCESETWAPDHYGQAVDPYWIRCGLSGVHDEHGDPGNTGCTWPLTDADRKAQEQLPSSCDECGVGYPCPTITALDGATA